MYRNHSEIRRNDGHIGLFGGPCIVHDWVFFYWTDPYSPNMLYYGRQNMLKSECELKACKTYMYTYLGQGFILCSWKVEKNQFF